MPIFHSRQNTELSTHDKVLKAAQKLFARYGYDGTTTKELAETAGIAEGTLFRHFTNKKAILVEVATNGWIELLTDLLTELSEMANYEAISQIFALCSVSMTKTKSAQFKSFSEIFLSLLGLSPAERTLKRSSFLKMRSAVLLRFLFRPQTTNIFGLCFIR